MRDWDGVLDVIRSDTKAAKWKYLRENKKKYFDESRNTSLECYLRVIFPETHDWIWDKMIPASTQKRLAGDTNLAPRRIRPDAFSESLGLVVEFDGLPHFQKLKTILDDVEKRDFYHSILSLKVVSIPYWIQLSRTNIKYLFDVDVEDRMCDLEYSFFDSPSKDFGLSISPAAMNAYGYERFCKEVSSEAFPDETREILRRDLSYVYEACMQEYGVDAVLISSNPLFI